jgi:hypothetical protein
VAVTATDSTALEAGLDSGVFTLTRSGNATAPLSVNVVLSGTALLNSDYTAAPLPLVIPAGASSATLVITPIDDPAEEGTETVTASITPSPDYTIGAPAAATLNILDNDANTAPVITRVSPASAGIGLVFGTGLILETTITDDGKPLTPGVVTATWTVQSGPGTATFGSPDQPNTTVRFSNSGTYVLRLTASDGALSSTLDVTVNVDAAPSSTNVGVAVDAGPDVNVVFGEQVSLSGTAADDGKPQPPGAFTLAWSKVSGPGSVTFGNPTAAATTVTASELGSYVLRLTASDGDVKTFDDVSLIFSLPVVSIQTTDATASEANTDSGVFTLTRSGNATAPLSVNVVLSGTALLNSDYTATTLPLIIPAGASGATIVITPLDDTTEEGTETVTATIATSSDYTISASGAATLNILDNDANTAPVITRVSPASASIGLVFGTCLILETTITDDGKPLTPGVVATTWTVQSGTGTVAFGSPDQPSTTVRFSTSGTYVLRLTASDGALSSTLDVTVNVDAAPTSTNVGVAVDAGPDVNVVLGEQASLSGIATDDGKPQPPGAFTLAWSKVSGPGFVTFGNPTSASTTVTASDLGSYVLRLTASDGDVKTFDEVTLISSLPVVSIQTTDATASETNTDSGAFTLTRSGNATAPLSVNVVLSGTALLNSDYTATTLPLSFPAGSSSATIVITPLDDTTEEGTETVTATIATSLDYTISASGAATLNILDNDANTAPVITRLSPVSASVGIVSGTGLILETTITDDGKPLTPGAITATWTMQSGPGTVTFGSPDQPNTTVKFSNSGTYVLRLTASDGALSSTLDVTVNVDAAPTSTNVGVAVDAGPDVNVVLGEQASLSGSGTDDGKPQPPAAFTLSWSKVSGPGSVAFGNPTAAATTVTPSDLGAYVLRLTANDGDVKTFDEVAMTASLPVVSIQATDATANELGSERGTFTVTRTGPTASPLTVSLAASGTATPGVDYVTLPQSAVIQAGQGSTTIFVTPLADGVAEGTESVNLTATPSTQYELGTPSSATVVVEDLPIDAWRLENFGSEANNPSIGGDLSDPDGDGVSNILEWAQGTSPVVAGATRPELGLEPGFLTLRYRRSDAAVDLTFAVYETEDLRSWALASSTEETLSDDGFVRVVKARVPLGTEGHKLIRLQISR